MVIIVVDQLIFLACWVPLIGVLVFDPFEAGQSPVYMTLNMIEAMLNPLFYLITMPVYRPTWWEKLKLSQKVTPVDEGTANHGATIATKVGGEAEQTAIYM